MIDWCRAQDYLDDDDDREYLNAREEGTAGAADPLLALREKPSVCVVFIEVGSLMIVR